jgi:hypothetical protein
MSYTSTETVTLLILVALSVTQQTVKDLALVRDRYNSVNKNSSVNFFKLLKITQFLPSLLLDALTLNRATI